VVVVVAVAVAVAALPSATSAEDDRIERLIQATADASFKVRLKAVVLLGRSNDARAVKPLISALSDDHYTVRAAACLGLGNLADPNAIAPLLEAVAADDDPFVRDEARAALARFDHFAGLQPLLGAASSNDVELRREAIQLLASWNENEARLRLVEALGDVEPIRQIAKQALATVGPEALSELLRGGLNSSKASVRLGSATLLGELGTVSAVGVLMDAYDQGLDNEELRRTVRDLLRGLQQLMPVADLMRDAVNGGDRLHTARALKLLGVVGNEAAVTELTRALGNPDVYLRGVAALSLAEAGDPRAVPALVKLASDPSNARIALIVRNSIQILQRKAKEEARQ
jgi:HEAT repeat protein